MSIYAPTLAGSNYFAFVICGFIAEHQGWCWVFYWPAIFLAFIFALLVLFMEETNDNRVRVAPAAAASTASSRGSVSDKKPDSTSDPSQPDAGEVYTREKTFPQKTSIGQPSPGQDMIHHAPACDSADSPSFSRPASCTVRPSSGFMCSVPQPP